MNRVLREEPALDVALRAGRLRDRVEVVEAHPGTDGDGDVRGKRTSSRTTASGSARWVAPGSIGRETPVAATAVERVRVALYVAFALAATAFLVATLVLYLT